MPLEKRVLIQKLPPLAAIALGTMLPAANGAADPAGKINLGEIEQLLILSQKGVANGLASLNESGKIPSGQLPSYVDDVIEAANYAALPGTGETGKIYITIDDGKCFRWSGSAYVAVNEFTEAFVRAVELTGLSTSTNAAVTTSNTILEAIGLLQAQINALSGGASALEPGMVFAWAGTSAPTGYLFCAGQNVSRSTYADLFTGISTTFGTGDGSTTFGIPDLRGRVVVGKDNMGGSAANRVTAGAAPGINGSTLGASGGSQEHALTGAQIPNNTMFAAMADGGAQVPQQAHTGTGSAHTNMQPSIVLNAIIKH